VHQARFRDLRCTLKGQGLKMAIMRNVRKDTAQCDEREHYRRNALDSWNHYQRTGLYITAEEADAWLARLEAGENAKIPECHV